MDHPLNLAHQQGRKADRFLQAGKFSEAIRCHEQAAEFLHQAINTTSSGQAVQSIKLQTEFHTRQKAIVLHKEETAAIFAKTLKRQQDRRKMDSTPAEKYEPKDQTEQPGYSEVLKTLAETDSLIRHLYERQHNSGKQAFLSPNTSSDILDSTSGNAFGIKTPKNDKVVIEELHTANIELKRWINHLLEELESMQSENKDLKERVQQFESDPSANPDCNPPSEDQSHSSASQQYYEDSLSIDNLDDLTLPSLETPVFDFGDLAGLEEELESLKVETKATPIQSSSERLIHESNDS